MTRLEFIKAGAAGAMFAAVGGCATATGSAAAGRAQFRVGFAGYTFHKFKPEEVVDLIVKSGAKGLCIKDSFVPFDATPAVIAERMKMLSDAGIVAYGAGPISIKNADDMKSKFDYVAALGVPVMVGVPWQPDPQGRSDWRHMCSSRKLCELAAKLAEEYRIDFAIHNHGKDPKYGAPMLYPTPADTFKMIEDLGPRMGLCMDIAYTSSDGFDPATEIRRFMPRVFDIHLRNISDPHNGSSGTAASLGTIDYLPVFRALAETGYSRWCGIELANAFGKGGETAWLADSVGYFQAMARVVQG